MSDSVEVSHVVAAVVARVVSNDELILNRGSEASVEKGMLVDVLDPQTLAVPDPETGADLGGIRRVKARLRVYEVTPTLALARVRRSSLALSGIALAFEVSPPPVTTDYLSDVRVGDPVELYQSK